MRKLASIEGVRYKMRETQVALAQAGSSAGFNMDTIVEELASPRREWRQKALGRLSAVEIFNSITGESQRSLRVGVIVPVHVVNIHDIASTFAWFGLRGKLWSRSMQPTTRGALRGNVERFHWHGFRRKNFRAQSPGFHVEVTTRQDAMETTRRATPSPWRTFGPRPGARGRIGEKRKD